MTVDFLYLRRSSATTVFARKDDPTIMPSPTNKDRDEEHRRRREVGEDTDRPDGRDVARKLYGPADADTTRDDRDENPTDN